MKIEQLNSVYFIGIGGIGMSALAKWFIAQGIPVGGYDRAPSITTTQLEELGAEIVYDDHVNAIPSKFKQITDENLVVYTPAIPGHHPQFSYYKNNAASIWKRSQILGLLTKRFKTLAVAGTHGKTTTSSMLAHILHELKEPMVAFLGGLVQNYESNFIMNLYGEKEAYVVVEADEFDRSFLTLHPDIAVITSIDPDHLDIYGEGDEVVNAFHDFTKQVKSGGKIIKESSIDVALGVGVDNVTYGLVNADCVASNVRFGDGHCTFDYVRGEEVLIHDIILQMPGYHNVLNASAAIAVSLEIGLNPVGIKAALASFGGVKRRFEILFNTEELVFVDDYAHHPTEIAAIINGVKSLWPSLPVTVLFQPHLFSRTRDFMDDFADSLSAADEVILLDIYPARELPIEGVTSDSLLSKIKLSDKQLLSKKEAVKEVVKKKGVILTLGAGDIDALVEPIKENLLIQHV